MIGEWWPGPAAVVLILSAVSAFAMQFPMRSQSLTDATALIWRGIACVALILGFYWIIATALT